MPAEGLPPHLVTYVALLNVGPVSPIRILNRFFKIARTCNAAANIVSPPRHTIRALAGKPYKPSCQSLWDSYAMLGVG